MGQQVDVSESVYFDVLPKLEAQTAEEEGGCMEQSIYFPVESYFDHEAQAESGITDVLEAETAVEELVVESYFDLETQVETSVVVVLEVETSVEELAVGSYFDLETQVETSLLATFDTEIVLEEGDVETVEADTIVETVEGMIKEFMFEAVEESESDLETEDATKEPNSDVYYVTNVDTEVETVVEGRDVISGSIFKGVELDYDLDVVKEGDVISESIYKAVGSDYDLDAKAEDMVEEAEAEVEEEDTLEGEDDMVEEEDDFVEEEDVMVKEEHDVIDDPMESRNSLEVEAMVEEGATIEESIYEPLESHSDLQVEEPEDLSDKHLNFWDDESDLSEEEWDLDAEEYSDIDPKDDYDMDSSDFDRTEEEEDDVVVSYLKSSTIIPNKACESLVLPWAKLLVTDIPTLGDSSLLESFMGCGPMLMLQECGNAVMNVVETLLRELSRIRNDLCHVLGALFH